ncbi:Oligo-1,6-glucosidase [Companilactobacillus paralimentarius]|uniref:glycoside hydrolase family 13 protein n=1 Tax=Companilactobacillus paralimentarius TaxID=83526 RepID=UPI003850771B
MTDQAWWKNAVGYQVYPRSFKDSNNDGIGDIRGIIEKLSYLKDLGIDFIWINPIYKSPNVDNGYDISDYESIEPEFGTMDDFKELLTKAHEIGIKVILDLVVNHTSDQHPWFIESQKSKDNPYRDYYLWADATPDKMPNDWKSFSGHSAWTYDSKTEQAYFHVFAAQQPDLNWKNSKVREEIYKMIRWWLDLGIDGFRMDAISHIQKEPWNFKIKDNPWAPFMNVKGIDKYMTELRDIFNEYNVMTVGEASGVTSCKAINWTDPERAGYINMIFELEQNVQEGKPGEQRINPLGFKKVLARWQRDLADGGWNALYVENHDNPRFNTVLGNETKHSAKAIAAAYMLLRGTPFIYQGQELGMTNFPFTKPEQMDDDDTKDRVNQKIAEGHTPKEAMKIISHWSRDNARTPMQWADKINAGFSDGKPWLAINENYHMINEADEANDANSVLNFYKQLIALRKSRPVFVDGTFELILDNDPDVFAYIRQDDKQEYLIISNLSQNEREVTMPNKVVKNQWQVNLTNNENIKLNKNMTLQPYDVVVMEKIN